MKLPKQRSPFTLILACAVVLAVAGCKAAPGKPGSKPEFARPEEVLEFAALYGQNCAACHGADGKNGAAISLDNDVYLAIAGKANIQRVTAAGVPGTAMPPFGKAAGGMLTDRQISILAEGMISNWGNPAALAGQTAPAYVGNALGNPAQGEKAFTTFCARCHGADATGAPAGNGVTTGSLVDPSYLALISDRGLRSIILAGEIGHADVNLEHLHPDRHDWRSYSTTHLLTDAEIADIVAWLASHRIATPGQPYEQHP